MIGPQHWVTPLGVVVQVGLGVGTGVGLAVGAGVTAVGVALAVGLVATVVPAVALAAGATGLGVLAAATVVVVGDGVKLVEWVDWVAASPGDSRFARGWAGNVLTRASKSRCRWLSPATAVEVADVSCSGIIVFGNVFRISLAKTDNVAAAVPAAPSAYI